MTSEPENVNAEATILRERETAMREILQVISASRTDPAPAFDMILKNASRLSGAPMANLCVLNETRSHWNLVAHFGEGLRHLTVGKTTRLSHSNLVPAQTMRTASIVHVENLMETDLYRQGDPGRVAMVKDEGMRTILGVPLLLEGRAIGCVTLFRREVKAFTQDEIELVETFAAQAVIVIENVRQFMELQTRLERERATGEVLQVISKSRDDEQPVFDAILRYAEVLCRAPVSALILAEPDDAIQRLAAHRGARPEAVKMFDTGQMPMDASQSYTAKCIIEGEVVALRDMGESDLYRAGSPVVRAMVDGVGVRSVIFAPLIRDGRAIGAVTVYRKGIDPFDDTEVALLETFAAQAVIAIENVRQFREVQERLEREIATGQILGAISRSRADTAPIFEEILESAARLCRAPMAWLLLLNSDRSELQLAAYHGPTRRALKIGQSWPLTPDRNMTGLGQALINALTVQDEDLTQVQGYLKGEPDMVQLVDEEGLRTRVSVPLVRDGQSIGAIVLSRREVSRFSNEDVRLADTFAAQAVIAIENVRQFKALETLNAELGDRVEAQVGEIERMGRLKRFLPSAVADAVVTTGDESMLSSHRALVATLFCDLRGFTAFCESAEPEETIEVLQTYHQEMSVLIDQHGGGVDQRAGDGIMVIFNDPIPVDDPAGDAIRLALAMRTKMRVLCADWKKLGHRLGFGVGISFGYATVGIVGSAGRFDYTASGTSINTAARLCDMAANDEILISPRTWAAVEGTFEAESRGEVEMKGIREPVEVFAVLSE